MLNIVSIDDAAIDIQQAASQISTATGIQTYNCKIPIDLDVPGKVLDKVVLSSGTYVFDNAEDTIEEQLSEDNAYLELWADNGKATAFVADTDNKVRKVTLMLNRPGTSTGNLQAHIYTDNSGIPGALLGSSGVVANSTITQGSKAEYTFTFSTEVPIVKDTKYHIVLTNSGDVNNKIYWYCTLTHVVVGEEASTQTAGVWTADLTRSNYYKVIGYYVTGSLTVPVTFRHGATYETINISKTIDAHSTLSVDILTSADVVIESDIVDGQEVNIDITEDTLYKIRVKFTRDSGNILVNPILSGISFTGTAISSKNIYVDRKFMGNSFNKLINMNSRLTRGSGGLLINSDANTEGNTDYSAGSQNFYTVTRWQELKSSEYGAKIHKAKVYLDPYNASNRDITLMLCPESTLTPGTPDLASPLGSATYAVTSTNYTVGWKEFVFSTAIEIAENTKYYLVLKSTQSVSYPDKWYYASGGYAASDDTIMNVGTDATIAGNTTKMAFELFGDLDLEVESELRFTGVSQHGVLGLLATVPDGTDVTIEAINPDTGVVIASCVYPEQIYLGLFSTELLADLKVRVIFDKPYLKDSPIIGLFYGFDGTPVAQPEEPQKQLFRFYDDDVENGNTGEKLSLSGVKGRLLGLGIYYDGGTDDALTVSIAINTDLIVKSQVFTGITTGTKYFSGLGFSDTAIFTDIPFVDLKIEVTTSTGFFSANIEALYELEV